MRVHLERQSLVSSAEPNARLNATIIRTPSPKKPRLPSSNLTELWKEDMAELALRQWSVTQPAPMHLTHKPHHTLSIANHVCRVTKGKLAEIAVQVFRADAV